MFAYIIMRNRQNYHHRFYFSFFPFFLILCTNKVNPGSQQHFRSSPDCRQKKSARPVNLRSRIDALNHLFKFLIDASSLSSWPLAFSGACSSKAMQNQYLTRSGQSLTAMGANCQKTSYLSVMKPPDLMTLRLHIFSIFITNDWIWNQILYKSNHLWIIKTP